jgi:hypothetical protein
VRGVLSIVNYVVFELTYANPEGVIDLTKNGLRFIQIRDLQIRLDLTLSQGSINQEQLF